MPAPRDAAGADRRAVLDGVGDVAIHRRRHRLGVDRTHRDAVAGRGAPRTIAAGGTRERVGELVGDGAGDEDPPRGAADLPGVRERRRGDRGGRALQVGVVEDDHRAVAAELEQQVLVPRRAGDRLAGARPAGQADRVDPAMGDQPLRDRDVVGQDEVHQPGRHTGLVQQVDQPRRRCARRSAPASRPPGCRWRLPGRGTRSGC